MTLLTRYLIRHFFLGCLPVLITLGTLFSFLVLTEELEDVGEGAYTTADALAVTLLTLPNRLLDLLPVTLLLGGMFGLGVLARQHEIVILRAAGLSLGQLARPLILTSAVVITSVVALRIYVIPDLELRAVQLQAKTQDTEIHRDREGTGYWMKTGGQLLHIDRLVDGHLLSGVEIYYLGDDGAVTRLIQADSGDIVGKRQWTLRDVREFDFSAGRLAVTSGDEMLWTSGLTGQQTQSLVVPVEAMSTPSLYRHIQLLKRSGLDSRGYQVAFWQQVSQLLAIAIMAVLSLPFVVGIQRGGGLARSALIGGVIGIGFYLMEQLMGQLSILVNIAPLFAALLPEVIMATLTVCLMAKINATRTNFS